jgi:trigger factor
VGLKKGESTDVNVTFPEDYMAKELAGKKAVFKVTVQT